MESHSKGYDQSQIKALERLAGDKLDLLIDSFGLDLTKKSKFYVGACPIHGGDNESAFNIFHSGDIVGNWRCFTHGCHNIFKDSILGFIRAIISKRKYEWCNDDNICPFNEAVDFLKKFTKTDNINDIVVDCEAIEMSRFVRSVEVFKDKTPPKILNIPRELVIKSLDIPSKYFISRGYTEEILRKYDIGDCKESKKEMGSRAVVPVYSDDRTTVVGCSGRSIYDRCPDCRLYHNTFADCPTAKYDKSRCQKWKHNSGFPGEHYFYNYWYAREYIRSSGIAILVESPGNVWRLEEAGFHMSLAMFGTNLSSAQRDILDKSGALALIILTDPDQAGKIAVRRITEMCGSSYSIYSPNITTGDDIGETECKIIQKRLTPVVEKITERIGYGK